MQTTSEIIDEYLDVFDNREPESMVQFFSEEAFLIWGNRVWKGHSELLKFYKELFIAELPSDMCFEIVSITTKDEVIQIVWHGQSPTRNIHAGVDTVVIRDGKIHSFTVHIEDEA
jgi:hypothetical protein